MVLSVVLNGLFSFCFVIALLFTIGDVNKVAASISKTGFPIIEGDMFLMASQVKQC